MNMTHVTSQVPLIYLYHVCFRYKQEVEYPVLEDVSDALWDSWRDYRMIGVDEPSNTWQAARGILRVKISANELWTADGQTLNADGTAGVDEMVLVGPRHCGEVPADLLRGGLLPLDLCLRGWVVQELTVS